MIFLLLSVLTAVGAELTGVCTRVLDGDTIEITVEGSTPAKQKIRMAQIDAPEKTQDYGVPSKVNLADLVLYQEVNVQYTKKDRYGRILGQVFVGDIDVNFAQVSAGLAWVYRDYPYTMMYFEEERAAREAQRGLWRDLSAVPPWVYRKTQKEMAKKRSTPKSSPEDPPASED
jgi:endonuclease YncB( thermonuclease family)